MYMYIVRAQTLYHGAEWLDEGALILHYVTLVGIAVGRLVAWKRVSNIYNTYTWMSSLSMAQW